MAAKSNAMFAAVVSRVVLELLLGRQQSRRPGVAPRGRAGSRGGGGGGVEDRFEACALAPSRRVLKVPSQSCDFSWHTRDFKKATHPQMHLTSRPRQDAGCAYKDT